MKPLNIATAIVNVDISPGITLMDIELCLYSKKKKRKKSVMDLYFMQIRKNCVTNE